MYGDNTSSRLRALGASWASNDVPGMKRPTGTDVRGPEITFGVDDTSGRGRRALRLPRLEPAAGRSTIGCAAARLKPRPHPIQGRSPVPSLMSATPNDVLSTNLVSPKPSKFDTIMPSVGYAHPAHNNK